LLMKIKVIDSRGNICKDTFLISPDICFVP
jgi:hypothetical protein